MWKIVNKWWTGVKDIWEFFTYSCFLKLNLDEVCMRVHCIIFVVFCKFGIISKIKIERVQSKAKIKKKKNLYLDLA